MLSPDKRLSPLLQKNCLPLSLSLLSPCLSLLSLLSPFSSLSLQQHQHTHTLRDKGRRGGGDKFLEREGETLPSLLLLFCCCCCRLYVAGVVGNKCCCCCCIVDAVMLSLDLDRNSVIAAATRSQTDRLSNLIRQSYSEDNRPQFAVK